MKQKEPFAHERNRLIIARANPIENEGHHLECSCRAPRSNFRCDIICLSPDGFHLTSLVHTLSRASSRELGKSAVEATRAQCGSDHHRHPKSGSSRLGPVLLPWVPL